MIASFTSIAALLLSVLQPCQQVGTHVDKPAVLAASVLLLVRPIKDGFFGQQVLVVAQLDDLQHNHSRDDGHGQAQHLRVP